MLKNRISSLFAITAMIGTVFSINAFAASVPAATLTPATTYSCTYEGCRLCTIDDCQETGEHTHDDCTYYGHHTEYSHSEYGHRGNHCGGHSHHSGRHH